LRQHEAAPGGAALPGQGVLRGGRARLHRVVRGRPRPAEDRRKRHRGADPLRLASGNGGHVKTYGLGILGCGDFTRIQSPVLQQSRRVRVAAVYDPNEAAARTVAERFGARVMGSAEALIGDPGVEIVVVYTPPFTHRELIEKAVAAGKRVIATKPLAPNVPDARAIAAATKDGRCLVVYKRTGNPQHHALKKLFASGEVGALALYRHDWVHHYPYCFTDALATEK